MRVAPCCSLKRQKRWLDACMQVVGGLGARRNGKNTAVVGARIRINWQVGAGEPDDIHGMSDPVVGLQAVQNQAPVAIVGVKEGVADGCVHALKLLPCGGQMSDG